MVQCCCAFMLLCEQHLSRVPNYSHHSKENHIVSSHFPFPAFLQPLATTTNMLSASIGCAFWVIQRHGIAQDVTCYLSFLVMSLRFTHIRAFHFMDSISFNGYATFLKSLYPLIDTQIVLTLGYDE